jgi:TIGR03009 family protein
VQPNTNTLGVPTGNQNRPQGQANYPDQPVRPNDPTFDNRIPLSQVQGSQPVVQLPSLPVLTPQQQKDVDTVLENWEKESKKILTFDCSFTRWSYDAGCDANSPASRTEYGVMRYGSPDKGLYRVSEIDNNGKRVPIEPQFIEHWMCDGKSVYGFKYPSAQKNPNSPKDKDAGTVTEYPLPPEMQGKAIVNGPFPFLFGAEATVLKSRYAFRVLQSNDPAQVWLEAYPKSMTDAKNFSRAVIVLNWPNMTPLALDLYSPGGAEHRSFEFFAAQVNAKKASPKDDPFKFVLPGGWQKMVQQMSGPDTQMANPNPNPNPQGGNLRQPAQATRPTGRAK